MNQALQDKIKYILWALMVTLQTLALVFAIPSLVLGYFEAPAMIIMPTISFFCVLGAMVLLCLAHTKNNKKLIIGTIVLNATTVVLLCLDVICLCIVYDYAMSFFIGIGATGGSVAVLILCPLYYNLDKIDFEELWIKIKNYYTERKQKQSEESSKQKKDRPLSPKYLLTQYNNCADRLAELKSLYDTKVLDEEEYASEKRKLMEKYKLLDIPSVDSEPVGDND